MLASPKKRRPRAGWCRAAVPLASLALAGCTGSVEAPSAPEVGNPAEILILSGFVGSPSLVDATVTLSLDDGSTSIAARSGDDTYYTLRVDRALAPPVRIQVAGGVDLPTGQPNETELAALTFATEPEYLSVTHLSTLAAHMSACFGAPTAASLAQAWAHLRERTGLDYLPEPASPTTPQLGAVLRANLILAESLDRTSAALTSAGSPQDANAVLEGIACDLADDGSLNLSGTATDARLLSTFRTAEAGVLLEMIAGTPYLDGQLAEVQLDETLRQVSGDLAARLDDSPIPPALVARARANLALLLQDYSDAEIMDMLASVAGDAPETAVGAALTAARLTTLWSLVERVAMADATLISNLADRMQGQPAAPAPVLSLSADPDVVSPGASSTLSWASSGADVCRSSGDWSGDRPLQGTRTTAALDETANFRLQCAGLGGLRETSVQVAVVDPAQRPIVSLSADAASIEAGQSTNIRWTSSNATACTASGAWSGARPVTGSEGTPVLQVDSDFSLSCTGPGGTDSATLRVTVYPAPEPTPEPEPAPAPEPTVSLSAVSLLVAPGSATTLNWSSTNADGCTASGGWSGSRAASGSASTGPLNARTTFSLSCSGAGGTALAMVSVSVNGSIELNWVAPTENVDGTPLTDLAGYRVYYGESSRAYASMTEVGNPATTSASITAPSGDYYVAMTALDQEGNESAYSNEVLKTVP